MASINILPALSDNYIYVIQAEKKAVVIDPGEDSVVKEFLKESGLELSAILLTHHHSDHIAGVGPLKEEFSCKVYAPQDGNIERVDEVLKPGKTKEVEGLSFEVIQTPGHTTGHISLFFPQQKWLFCGDVLFGCGCGKIFEGTFEQMMQSVLKLKKLPDETLVYCGHEYTLNNLRFSLSMLPDDEALKKRFEKEKSKKCTIPLHLGEEKQSNLFLRVDSEKLQKALNVHSQLEAFTKLRVKKDEFKG